MTVADDLVTLRGTLNKAAFGSESTSDLLDADAALDRVEAEIARLTEEKDGWQEEARAYELRLRRYDAPAPWEAQVALAEAMCEKEERRAVAAEAEIARLERENEHLHLRIQRKNERLNAAEAEVERLRDGLRPFVEDYDFHAADYLANLVDGEEARVLTARTVESLIEDQRKARALLAEDGAA